MDVRSGGGLISRGAGAAITQRGARHSETVHAIGWHAVAPTAAGAPLQAAPRSPVWMSLWVSIVFLSLNVFPHNSHMKSLIPAERHTSVTVPQLNTHSVLSLTRFGTWRGCGGRWTPGASARSCPHSSENWLTPPARGPSRLLRRQGGRSVSAQGPGDCQTFCVSGV